MTLKEILSNYSYDYNKYVKSLFKTYYDIIPNELEFKYTCLNEELIKLKILIKQRNNLTNELFELNDINDNNIDSIKKIKYNVIKELSSDRCNWDEIINLANLAKEEKKKESNKKEKNRIDIISNSVKLSNTITKIGELLKNINYLKAKNKNILNNSNRILNNIHMYLNFDELPNDYKEEFLFSAKNFVNMRLNCFYKLEEIANNTINSVHREDEIRIDDSLLVVNNALNNVSYGCIDELSYLSNELNYVTLDYFKSNNKILESYNSVLSGNKTDLKYLSKLITYNKDMFDKIDLLDEYNKKSISEKKINKY